MKRERRIPKKRRGWFQYTKSVSANPQSTASQRCSTLVVACRLSPLLPPPPLLLLPCYSLARFSSFLPSFVHSFVFPSFARRMPAHCARQSLFTFPKLFNPMRQPASLTPLETSLWKSQPIAFERNPIGVNRFSRRPHREKPISSWFPFDLDSSQKRNVTRLYVFTLLKNAIFRVITKGIN